MAGVIYEPHALSPISLVSVQPGAGAYEASAVCLTALHILNPVPGSTHGRAPPLAAPLPVKDMVRGEVEPSPAYSSTLVVEPKVHLSGDDVDVDVLQHAHDLD